MSVVADGQGDRKDGTLDATRGDLMAYSVPRCAHCGGPAIRDKREAEEVAVATAALPRGQLTCRACGKAFVVDGRTEWIEIPEG